DGMANRPRAPMPSRRAGPRREWDSIPDSRSVPPPAWPSVGRDAVAAVAARAVRARPVVHLTADDRRFGHRVLRPVAAARGGDTGKDTRAGMPVKAPSSPRAASRAGRRPGRAFRRLQRPVHAILGPQRGRRARMGVSSLPVDLPTPLWGEGRAGQRKPWKVVENA